jgi:hypothetical protein
MDQGVMQASIGFYYSELLGGLMKSQLQIMEFLETLTLKDVAYSVDLTWGKLQQLLVQTARKSGLEKLSQKTR